MAKQRGVYEKVVGSGVWWIQYYNAGQRHREKVGRKSDALALYQTRKADARAGVKLTGMLSARQAATVADLVDLALYATRNHSHQSSYVSKAKFVLRDLGTLEADKVTAQELDRWLTARCKTPATYNRYRAFLSLCWREGHRNGKVTANPARLVKLQKELRGRTRFLSRVEYTKVCAEIERSHPKLLPCFIVSVNTGMRLSEQFTVQWSQVIGSTIHLTKTKNGDERIVHLNADAMAAIQNLRKNGHKATDLVFPRWLTGKSLETKEWFRPCLAAAGVTDYTWRGNRHTFCSWLAMAGATMKDIQVLAGQKTLTMTSRYMHLSPAQAQSAVNLISSVPAFPQENQTAIFVEPPP